MLLKWEQGSQPMTFAVDAGLLTMAQGASVTTLAFDNNGNQVEEDRWERRPRTSTIR